MLFSQGDMAFEVMYFAQDEKELNENKIDDELRKNKMIVCVAYQKVDNHTIAFGACRSYVLKYAKILKKIALGRLEKCPNYESCYTFDPFHSIIKMGVSGNRLLAYKPKTMDDILHQLFNSVTFTRIFQDTGKKSEWRDTFIDRVTVVKFSIHWSDGMKLIKYGASIWFNQEDTVNISLLEKTAEFRFLNCPMEIGLPQRLSLSLDEFIRKSTRRYGCHKKTKSPIFP